MLHAGYEVHACLHDWAQPAQDRDTLPQHRFYDTASTMLAR